MQSQAPGITVNGVLISPDEINGEMQYHPAASLFDAKYEAMQALVIREILIQRAVELELCKREQAQKNLDETIDLLLEKEISVPQADKETCRRYFNRNRDKFRTSPLFEVSHILYLAPPEDECERESARLKAETALAAINKAPERFESIARAESACPSSRDGGRLGQIGRGQTMPDFEKALFRMREGELSTEPVATQVGYHIIKVHKRADGRELPFENVEQGIGAYLEEQSWNKAFQQYIRILAGNAKISGFLFEGAQVPLVQ